MRVVSDIKNSELTKDAPKILRLNIFVAENDSSRRFRHFKLFKKALNFSGSGIENSFFSCGNLLMGGLIFLLIFFAPLKTPFFKESGNQRFVSAPTLSNENFAAAQEQVQSKEQERQELEAQLEELEKQIKEYENTISVSKQQSKTLKSEIVILENKIAKTNLQIKSTQINLKKVSAELQAVEQSLNVKELEIEKQKNILASGIQTFYEEAEVSLFEIFLEHHQLSDFFNQMNYFTNLQQANKESLDKIIVLKQEFDEKKEDLALKRRDTVALKNIQDIQKEELSDKQSQKNNLLTTTKGNEKKYQELLKKSQETAAQIRSRIYELLGIGTPITFGEAVKIANHAFGATGVQPAFLLAVISQESELGKNVGTCNRAGDPPEKSWTKVMKPGRDQEPFKRIIAELNKAGIKMDINITPVSCPMRDKDGGYVGWGGAMGPAQFIPSTWVLMEDKIKEATGHSVVSPWNVLDAFMGAALYLKDLGAAKGDYNSQWKAAMKYFSGSTNLRYRFYGDNVMARAGDYEDDIKAITN